MPRRLGRFRRFRGDSGAATTELVIIVPVLLTMMLLVIQYGLYFHASSVASAAAQEGAATASVHDGPDRVGHGEAEARDFVDVMAPDLLEDVGVHGRLVDGDEMVQVDVDARVKTVFRLPGVDMRLTVHETAESPVEKFRPAGEAP
jgi:Flp pilus assembly protein TadG